LPKRRNATGQISHRRGPAAKAIQAALKQDLLSWCFLKVLVDAPT
jgi:hypothetical protein